MDLKFNSYNINDEHIPWHDWQNVLNQNAGNTFSMEQPFLRCTQRSLSNSSQIRLVLFYQHQQPVAIACLSLLHIDPVLQLPISLRNGISQIRRFKPGLLHIPVLFCGLPVSMGQKSLLFTSNAERNVILSQLNELMNKLAQREGARYQVFKDHAEHELAELRQLKSNGYRQAQSLAMNLFTEPFNDFRHYMANLRTHYRNDIRRSLRKLERAGIETRRWTKAEDMQTVYTDQLHKLYTAVALKADIRFDILKKEFFHELIRQFPKQLSLTCLYKDGRVIAFNWSLQINDTYQFLYCGIDYQYNNKLDLYFNLLYTELDYALQSNANEIRVGQTASQFKARLGCTQQPLHLFIKGTGSISDLLLGALFNKIFNRQQEQQPFNIYNLQYREEKEMAG